MNKQDPRTDNSERVTAVVSSALAILITRTEVLRTHLTRLLPAATRLDGVEWPERIAPTTTEDATREFEKLGALCSGDHARMLIEMVLCKGVDSFLSYVSELLGLVYRTRPETMKSKEQVTIERILNYSNYEELLAALSEEKVHSLSYKSFADLNDYVKERMEFPLLRRTDAVDLAVEMIETRNLIVHNHGIINRLFLKRVHTFSGKLGDTVDLHPILTTIKIGLLVGFAKITDERAIEKFGLPTTTVITDLLKA